MTFGEMTFGDGVCPCDPGRLCPWHTETRVAHAALFVYLTAAERRDPSYVCRVEQQIRACERKKERQA